jgi:TonB family protein
MYKSKLITFLYLLLGGCCLSPKHSSQGQPSPASYAQSIKALYHNNWSPLYDSKLEAEGIQVTAKVVIKSDGEVLSAKIEKESADSRMNDSVRQLLGRIRHVAAFEDGATNQQRTFTITFKFKSRK